MVARIAGSTFPDEWIVRGNHHDAWVIGARDPMSGRDRRVIHVALRGAEGIATMSIGEGRYRQVLVVPAGAPEWAEAKAASESANG